MTDSEIIGLWDKLRWEIRAEGKPFGGDMSKFVVAFARAYELKVLGGVITRLRPLAEEGDGLLQQAGNVIEELISCVELEAYPFEPADIAGGNDIRAKIIDHLERYGCWSKSNTPPVNTAASRTTPPDA